ncbi:MAG: cytidylate kinase family protein [bacterium]
MALITVSGQPGCRHEEAARLAAQALNYELITETRLRALLEEEFGRDAHIPDKAFAPAVTSIVAHLATAHHLVISADGCEFLFKDFPTALRVQIVAPESRRIGIVMLENRLDRPAAAALLKSLEAEARALRKRRFGRVWPPPQAFDLVLNTEVLDAEQVAALIRDAAELRGLTELGLLSPQAEAHVQFQARLKLSKYGIEVPGKAEIRRKPFSHPSEETFANLLDFYRIAWEYEPRSFAIKWDKEGRVLEAFTPDFYLPEFDLYVELTTMKQSLVTRKNRKVKMLRAIYPHINVQVFYQKDIENLIFKYGLAERTIRL